MSAKLSGKVSELPAETLASLKRLGFSDYESRIYIDCCDQVWTLLNRCRKYGVPRSITYNTPESPVRQRRAGVGPSTEGPTVMWAAPAPRLSSRIAEEKRSLCSRYRARNSEEK